MADLTVKGIDIALPEWTGLHIGACGNSGRGGPRRPESGCLPSCDCPCHRGSDYYSSAVSRQRSSFDAAVQAERQTHPDRGYTTEHDDRHGIDHLLMWAQEYAFQGEPVKSASLIEAAREKLIRDRFAAAVAPKPMIITPRARRGGAR